MNEWVNERVDGGREAESAKLGFCHPSRRDTADRTVGVCDRKCPLSACWGDSDKEMTSLSSIRSSSPAAGSSAQHVKSSSNHLHISVLAD